jgi:broad specificity phosphatase PhoE
MTSDVRLSDAGKLRANSLSKQMKNAHLRYIYSTNFLRTRSTVEPTSEATGIPISLYNHVDSLLNVLKGEKGNVLIVGHSNTVDDIVNGLAGKTFLPGDLPDTAYGDLFIVNKHGKQVSFSKERF